jgi:hypothetical protein
MKPTANPALRALTLAAAALPGLAPAQVADGDNADFTYGHYVEGARELYGTKSKYHPIQVDSIMGGGQVTFKDRWSLGFRYLQDTWGGATPIATAPFAFGGNHQANTKAGASPFLANVTVFYDRKLNFYRQEPGGVGTFRYIKDGRVAHTLAAASPETRKQGNLRLGYEWDRAAMDVGLGLSLENDYDSRFVSLNGRLDFDQKRTVVNAGLNYTHSAINATLDPTGTGYFFWQDLYDQGQVSQKQGVNGNDFIRRGVRQDWAPHLGITQVLDKNSTFSSSVGYTRSTGFLENPYKAAQFIFLDFASPIDATGTLFQGESVAPLERRPDVRNQITFDNRYVYYFEPLDAALHLGYRFSHDDWGIDAHAFQADWSQPLSHGWTVTPSIRYYSQTAANFYQPYFVFNQSMPRDPVSFQLDPSRLPIANFSSDHRLSGFGALSGGVTVSKRFNRGISLEGSFEYYTHSGGLKLGGGGEGSYADFDYYQLSGTLKMALDAPASLDGGAGDEHEGHAGHHHHGSPPPAGVMFGHMLKAGEFMAGYRYMYSLEGGPLLHDGTGAPDAAVVAAGCGIRRCGYRSKEMSMHMHMLDLMYAPTDWLNLMLMPQFMSMDMRLRELTGGDFSSGGHGGHSGATIPHATGGVGDTGLYGMVRLFELPHHRLHATIGVTAPTGDVDIEMRHGGFIHYGMQLGSGTWDFRPSLTYTGDWERWSWGAQVSGTKRLESRNESGYALGDIFQSTVWGAYRPLDWLSASVRGVYTTQGSIRGRFSPPLEVSAPVDLTSNYGGRHFDVGFGLNAVVPQGSLRGHQVGLEWLQPLDNDPNGYQLERKGSLFATWTMPF